MEHTDKSNIHSNIIYNKAITHINVDIELKGLWKQNRLAKIDYGHLRIKCLRLQSNLSV